MQRFDRDGLTFEISDDGPRDGDAVVCLHGFPQDTATYDEITSHLTEHGLRVLRPLQRGYSPAARPSGRRAYAVPELVADILALLDAAGLDRAHVVGHDWGGLVAWALAGRHPTRVRTVTVLSTPHPAAFAAAARRGTQALRSSYIALFQLPWLPERLVLARRGLLLRRALRASGLRDDVAARYAQGMLEPGAAAGALAWYRALPLSPSFRAGRIRVPTGFGWGQKDPAFSTLACELTGTFVDAPYVERRLADAGHWLPENHAGDVAQVVLETVAQASG